MICLAFDGLFHSLHPAELRSDAPPKVLPSYRTSPGLMCYGWLITCTGRLIAHGHGGYVLGSHASSNLSEYLALIEGLEALLDRGMLAERV